MKEMISMAATKAATTVLGSGDSGGSHDGHLDDAAGIGQNVETNHLGTTASDDSEQVQSGSRAKNSRKKSIEEQEDLTESISCSTCPSLQDDDDDENDEPERNELPVPALRASLASSAGGLYDDDSSISSHKEEEEEEEEDDDDECLFLPRVGEEHIPTHSDRTMKLDNTSPDSFEHSSQESWFSDLECFEDLLERRREHDDISHSSSTTEMNPLVEEEGRDDPEHDEDDSGHDEDASIQLSIVTKMSEITMMEDVYSLFDTASVQENGTAGGVKNKTTRNLYQDDEDETNHHDIGSNSKGQADASPITSPSSSTPTSLLRILKSSQGKETLCSLDLDDAVQETSLTVQQEIQWRQERLHQLQQEQAKLLREVNELQFLLCNVNGDNLQTPTNQKQKKIMIGSWNEEGAVTPPTLNTREQEGDESPMAQSQRTPTICNRKSRRQRTEAQSHHTLRSSSFASHASADSEAAVMSFESEDEKLRSPRTGRRRGVSSFVCSSEQEGVTSSPSLTESPVGKSRSRRPKLMRKSQKPASFYTSGLFPTGTKNPLYDKEVGSDKKERRRRDSGIPKSIPMPPQRLIS
mmetsp:Transcript_5586/g.14147  ORF Transcript_5586/g.14147 Transcript_5586/m.14147 type:complete len:581 (-) Transcript_5586:190-1932(-)